jgi:hypothetical protein
MTWPKPQNNISKLNRNITMNKMYTVAQLIYYSLNRGWPVTSHLPLPYTPSMYNSVTIETMGVVYRDSDELFDHQDSRSQSEAG